MALALQGLRRQTRTGGEAPLVRLENRKEAADAPFQFDPANAVLHRTGCTAIPKTSHSALYAVWKINKEDLKYACPRCRPMNAQNKTEASFNPADVLFGLLSVLDQFGTILHERGRDYRRTNRGKQMEEALGGLIGNLDEQQKKGMTALNSGLDALLKTVGRASDALGGNRPPEKKNGKKKRQPKKQTKN